MLRAERDLVLSSPAHYTALLPSPTPGMLYKWLSHYPKVMCPVSGKYSDRNKTELFQILDSKNTNFMDFKTLFKLV